MFRSPNSHGAIRARPGIKNGQPRDEREHWFLIEGGADFRLDARVEQLFEAMNGFIAPPMVDGAQPHRRFSTSNALHPELQFGLPSKVR